MSLRKFFRITIPEGLNENTNLWKMLISELLGTMLLVAFACGFGAQWTESVDSVHLALASGLAVATIVQFTGPISGGHINPAVSLAMFITGRLCLVLFILFAICQCLGAVIGALVIKVLTPPDLRNNLGITTLNPQVTELSGVWIEFLITFIMVMTAFSVSDINRDDFKGSAPLAVGLAVATSVFLAVYSTGASMNPARSMGPAFVFNEWDHHWVYWVGPCCGAVVAGVLYHRVFKASGSLPDPPAITKMKHETINLG